MRGVIVNELELDKRLKSIEKRLDDIDSKLSVQNSAIRTVSDCLEHDKVQLNDKINDLITDTQIEDGNIYDTISDVIDHVFKVKFTAEVNKATLLMYGDKASVRSAMNRAEREIKSDWEGEEEEEDY